MDTEISSTLNLKSIILTLLGTHFYDEPYFLCSSLARPSLHKFPAKFTKLKKETSSSEETEWFQIWRENQYFNIENLCLLNSIRINYG